MSEWINQENTRAKKKQGTLANTKSLTQKRIMKTFRLSIGHAMAFDTFASEQKYLTSRKSYELLEEAIDLLLKKYKQKLPHQKNEE